MEIKLSTKQTLAVSPQLMQSMEILQMGSQELLEHIQELTQENPVLELAPADQGQDEFSLLKRKLEWLDSTDVQNRAYHRDDAEPNRDPVSPYGTAGEWEDSLYSFLLSQLDLDALPPSTAAAVRFVVEGLNQSGCLDEDLPELVAQSGFTEGEMEAALRIVQGLEPAGVAARNLSECLCLQLDRRQENNSLARRIAQDYLEPLARGRYSLMARELGADPGDVRAACDLIRSLNPRPGAGFSERENLSYITPDIIVVNFPNHFEILSNDYYFPSLSLSGYYNTLLRDTEETEVREYLTQKMRQAKWVMRSIEQRRSTLMACAQCIVDAQEDFFRRGAGHLVPMVMADVAQKLDIHESTVSRAVKDKYIQCSSGIYPFNFFFSRALGSAGTHSGESVSPDTAKAMLKRLIAEEDKTRPLSDQKLCQLMEGEKIFLSRRTVAKYREELRIPPASGRRQYQ